MATWVGLILIAAVSSTNNLFLSSASGEPLPETKIQCHAEETHHFHYSSTSKLWGSVGGDVVVDADVVLHCVGENLDGKYESKGFKFLAEISNLVMEPKNGSESGIPVDQASTFGDKPEPTPEQLKPYYSVPFQFVQLLDGSVPEIWFAQNEVTDARIRNFKRHLVDAFATHISAGNTHEDVVETTVTGQHTSSYDIKLSEESAGMFAPGLDVPPGQTVIVGKTVTEDQIIQLSPSDALNNKEKMKMNLQQTQVFKGGKLLQSSGTSSIALQLTTPRSDRFKRGNEDDEPSNFQAQTSFNIQLQRRYRRSVDEAARLELHADMAFIPSSRFAENENSFEQEKLRELRKSLGNLKRLFQGLLDRQHVQAKDYEEKMQVWANLLQREVELKLDDELLSASNIVRKTLNKDVLLSMCSKKFTVCQDFLQLLAIAGGLNAEEVFLSLLKSEKFKLAHSQIIADIIADFSHPSPDFIDALVQYMTDEQRSIEIRGPLSLSCGALGSKADLDTKSKMTALLIGLLGTRESSCENPQFLIDLLEAIGNLNSQETVSSVLEVSRKCKDSSAIQIACAHALRHHVDLPSVMLWIQDMLDHEDCDVVNAIAEALSDKTLKQELVGDSASWPRNDFNKVDRKLERILSHSRCSVQNIAFYFGKKKNHIANKLASEHSSPVPWNSSSRSLTSNEHRCNDWISQDKIPPIQTQSELDADKYLYDVTEHCIHRRRYGDEKANIQFISGTLSAYRNQSTPFESKQLIHASLNVRFLGTEKNMFAFAFYTKTGKSRDQRLYARIFDNTRPVISKPNCNSVNLKYHKRMITIPVWSLNIYVIKIDLSIDLVPEVGLQGSCPVDTLFMLAPRIGIRVEGRAGATIIFVYGALSLGGNLGGRLELLVLPFMCFGGNIGTEPMSISIRAYFQIWWPFWGWSREHYWTPPFMSWDIVRGVKAPMFKKLCLK